MDTKSCYWIRRHRNKESISEHHLPGEVPNLSASSRSLLNTTATLVHPQPREQSRLPSLLLSRSAPIHCEITSLPALASTFKLPSLDYSHTQAGQYWPGANESSPATTVQSANTLPTPPSTGDESFKPTQHRQDTYNMATMVQQPGMISNLEPMGAPTSFSARRSAASQLPNFELPPPQLASKFPSLSTINATQPSPANISVGNLLTPPSNISGGSLSPISTGTNSANNSAANQGLPPYTPTGFWPPPGSGLTPFTSFGTGTTPQPYGQGSLHNLFPPRGLFSPSLNSMLRNNSNSPTAAESVPPPPYDFQLPPFTSSAPMSVPGSVPAPNTQQQQQNQHQQQQQQHQQQQQVMAYMNSQAPMSAVSTQSPPLNHSESYVQRPPPTPTYYNGSQPSSTPQQSHFPGYTAPSPVQQSPMSAGAPGSKLSPNNSQPSLLQPSPSQPMHTFTRPFNPYPPMPTMSGPILSNMQNPAGHMSLVGGLPSGIFNSGLAAQMPHMYTQQQPPHNDRPFKCDQCPQSFNRNHDLKRHKRIHLAVKPFPCGHCDKSFSRKDALKVSLDTTFSWDDC